VNRTLPSGVTQPPIALVIIGLCALMYVFIYMLAPRDTALTVFTALALWPPGTDRMFPWQLITYGFLHGSFGHLFFNMFAVWMFGTQIERAWGSQRFVTFYVACLLGAALTQLVVQGITGEMWPTVGASGAVFGLLLAFGVMYPEQRVFLIFLPVPIKAKWFVLIYAGVELLFGLTGTMPTVAHFAHLGGLFGGAVLLWRWGWRPGMTWKF
jgi:membrane associated rhomboid family serine protease